VRKKLTKIFLITLSLYLIGNKIQAHHSFAAEFLEDEIGTIEGMVTEVWFKNPHVRYYLEIQTETGKTESWDIRTDSPTLLVRSGWTRKTIQEGDHIKVLGHLGRDGRKLISIINIELENGTILGKRD
tara:strand:+ start:82 stop:465 length:384 start_codon:yes stop_codon:yes gene_type:complete